MLTLVPFSSRHRPLLAMLLPSLLLIGIFSYYPGHSLTGGLF
jgi:hypothetical protein